MNRVLIAVTLAASMFTTNLLAAEISTANAPLAPGAAAGVQKADAEDWTLLWIFLGIGAVAGIALSQESVAPIPNTISGLAASGTSGSTL